MHYFIWIRSGICKLGMFTYICLRTWKLVWLASWSHHIDLENLYHQRIIAI